MIAVVWPGDLDPWLQAGVAVISGVAIVAVIGFVSEFLAAPREGHNELRARYRKRAAGWREQLKSAGDALAAWERECNALKTAHEELIAYCERRNKKYTFSHYRTKIAKPFMETASELYDAYRGRRTAIPERLNTILKDAAPAGIGKDDSRLREFVSAVYQEGCATSRQFHAAFEEKHPTEGRVSTRAFENFDTLRTEIKTQLADWHALRQTKVPIFVDFVERTVRKRQYAVGVLVTYIEAVRDRVLFDDDEATADEPAWREMVLHWWETRP